MKVSITITFTNEYEGASIEAPIMLINGELLNFKHTFRAVLDAAIDRLIKDGASMEEIDLLDQYLSATPGNGIALTTQQAAQLMGVIERRIRQLVPDRLPARKLGRDWIIMARDFFTFAHSHSSKPGPKPKK